MCPLINACQAAHKILGRPASSTRFAFDGVSRWWDSPDRTILRVSNEQWRKLASLYYPDPTRLQPSPRQTPLDQGPSPTLPHSQDMYIMETPVNHNSTVGTGIHRPRLMASALDQDPTQASGGCDAKVFNSLESL